MAEYPSLPLFTDSFISDTIHLNAAQTGAYLMLLMVAWRTKDCRLPDNDDVLARYARMEKRAWLNNRDVILSFWKYDNEGFLYQKRLSDERAYADSKRDSAIRAGTASALKRKKRHSTDVIAEVQREANHPTPTPTIEIVSTIVDTISSAPSEIKIAFDLYNETAIRIGAPQVIKLTESRKSKIKARLKDCGGIEGWKRALEKIEASSFCRGEVSRFTATLDFMLQESSFTKILEGNYDDKQTSKGNQNGKTHAQRADEAIQRAIDAERAFDPPDDSQTPFLDYSGPCQTIV